MGDGFFGVGKGSPKREKGAGGDKNMEKECNALFCWEYKKEPKSFFAQTVEPAREENKGGGEVPEKEKSLGSCPRDWSKLKESGLGKGGQKRRKGMLLVVKEGPMEKDEKGGVGKKGAGASFEEEKRKGEPKLRGKEDPYLHPL